MADDHDPSYKDNTLDPKSTYKTRLTVTNFNKIGNASKNLQNGGYKSGKINKLEFLLKTFIFGMFSHFCCTVYEILITDSFQVFLKYFIETSKILNPIFSLPMFTFSNFA